MAETRTWTLAERALLFQYVKDIGLPEWAGSEIEVFAGVAGCSVAEACAAYAENEDKGMIGRVADGRP